MKNNGYTIEKCRGYVYYFKKSNSLSSLKCGKWMYFFNDRTFAESICIKAMDEQIVDEVKHSDSEDGVICFYLNVDDLEAHERVINFFIDNRLIRISKKTGKYYNISYKRDSETHNGQYNYLGNFDTEIKLDKFIDLKSGQWIMNSTKFEKLIPLDLKLLSTCEDFEIDKVQFEKDSVHKYILSAFPTYCSMPLDFKGCKVHFFTRKIPETVIDNNYFYIVTFRAVFELKEGKEPFIKCKTSLLYGLKPLITSDVYSNGKYYRYYKDINGNMVMSFPKFTLVREDYEKFIGTYSVLDLEVICGCYFQ